MSLAKIAKVKVRKRRYADGGSESDTGEGPSAGPGDGPANGPSGSSAGQADADRAAGDAAAGPAPGPENETGGGSNVPGTGGNIGGLGSTPPGPVDADLALAAFDRSQPSRGLQDAAAGALGKTGLAGLALSGLAALDRGMAARNSGDGYGIDVAGNKVGDWGGASRSDTSDGDRRPSGGGDTPAVSNPFGSDVPTQTTPADGSTGMRKYVWDPVARQYTLTNVGAGDNPMGYTQGQTFKMAAGGPAPSGIAAGAPMGPRFVQGGGTGLSDSVPVSMDDGGQGRLADGEFVIPADVVSGLGGGSSKAGADILYQMMERIRQQAHGSKQQVRPVDPQQVMPA